MFVLLNQFSFEWIAHVLAVAVFRVLCCWSPRFPVGGRLVFHRLPRVSCFFFGFMWSWGEMRVVGEVLLVKSSVLSGFG